MRFEISSVESLLFQLKLKGAVPDVILKSILPLLFPIHVGLVAE